MVNFEVMKIWVLLFGITRDIVGERQIEIELPVDSGTDLLKKILHEKYPDLDQLDSVAVAVNNEYVRQDQVLHEQDEIALIPPVSGG